MSAAGARRGLGLVLAFAALLFVANTWGYDLWAPDEPYFAEGAREMLADGHWAVPHVNGVVTTDKPALFFWLIALFSLPFGEVLPFSARLTSILASLGTVFLVVRLGRRHSDLRTALLAGVVLATTWIFWERARWTQIDALLCFLIWLALSAFEAWRAGDARGRRAGALFWLATGLAVLAKGPVGLVVPVGIAVTTLAFDRRLRSWREFAPFLGPAIFLAVVSAWILIATFGGGGEYSVLGAFKEHVVDRSVHGMHHAQPWHYFFTQFPPLLLPWLGLLPGALLLAWRRREPADRWLLVTAGFVILFFSIPVEKRTLYALPAVPAFALLAARLVGAVLGWDPQPARPLGARWVTVGQGLAGLLFLLAGLFLAVKHGDYGEYAPTRTALLLSAALLALGAATLVSALKGRVLASVACTAGGMALAYLLTAFLLFPALEPRKSARPFTERIVELTADARAGGARVLCYRLDNLPEHFAFYSGGMYTLETDEPEVLSRHLGGPEPAFAVVNGDALSPLPAELLDRLQVLARTRLARRPVLLVTNRPHPGGTPLGASAAAEPATTSGPPPAER